MATWWGSDEQTGPVLSSSWRWPQPPPKPLPNQIPIDGEPLTSPRGFLLRRLSDAGPRHGCTVQRTGRHPKPFTKAAIREVANLEARTDSNAAYRGTDTELSRHSANRPGARRAIWRSPSQGLRTTRQAHLR